MTEERREAWQRGPVDGVEPLLMPVVHALIEAREEMHELVAAVPAEHVWVMPGGAASIGFHVRHLGGALERLFTYARGERLSDEQRAAARTEALPGEPPMALAEVARQVDAQIEGALAQVRGLTAGELLEARAVGRAALPSTTLGLLFHAAEHCTRHMGQAITTAKILRGGGR